MGSTGAFPHHLKGYLEYVGFNVQQKLCCPLQVFEPKSSCSAWIYARSFYPFGDPPRAWKVESLNFAFHPTFPALFSGGAGRRACFICGDQFAEDDDVMGVLTLAKQTSLTQGWMD